MEHEEGDERGGYDGEDGWKCTGAGDSAGRHIGGCD